MPEYCTCRTRLVEDARFCHKCGRALFELDAAVTPPPPLPQQPTLQARIAQLPVSFSNPIALRVAFLMSLAIMLIEMIPVLNLLLFVWCLAAGWCAVLLYRGLTGSSLSVRAGARLGSITGVLTFVSITIILVITMLVMGQQLFDQMVQQDPRVKQVANDPAALVAGFLIALGMVFAVVVGICTAGGALGARFSAPKANG